MFKRLVQLLPFVLVSCLALTNAARAADPSLVGWWKLDETSGTTAADSSGNNNNGTLIGGPVWVPGQLAGALQFDGVDDYVDCGNGPTFNITQQVTLALWVNPQDIGNTQDNEWLGKGDQSYCIKGYRSGNTIEFFIYDGAWFSAIPDVGAAFNNTWHHVAGTYDGTALNVYIDGVLTTTLAHAGSIASAPTYNVNIARNAQNTGRLAQAIIDDARIYNRALSEAEIRTIMKGSDEPGISGGPDPASKATDVPRDVVLVWKSGQFAASHDVYFGTSFDDVNNASRTSPLLVSKGQEATSYDPAGLLEYGQTYYWRIDEVNAPPTESSIYKGATWSFTAETYGYPITTPIKATASSNSNPLTSAQKTIDGSGLTLDQHSVSSSMMWLSKKNVTPIWIQYEFSSVYKLNQMWVWNSNQLGEPDYGFGAKEVTIECSTDGNTWTAVGGVTEFAQAPGEENYEHNTTVDFGGAVAKYVRLTILNNWADSTKQAGLSEVRFFYIPVKASGPTPTTGATDVALDGVLNWRPGREAVKHEVSFGTDPNAMALVKTVTEHSYGLGSAGLEYGKTYYWKVNEVNDAASPTSWAGDVWSFTTVGYTVVEDFESYNDLCNRIFWTWLDQYGYNATPECGGAGAPGNGSNASVGNDSPPYAEKTIRHGGVQSLPMTFDNTRSPYYSETQREWTTPQSWTGGGADTLRVYLRGDAAAFIETSPGTLIMNGTGTDIYNTTDEFRFVYKQLKGNGSIVARVDSLAVTNAWSKAGVMIRETQDPASTHAMTVVSGSSGIAFQQRIAAAGASTSTQPTITPTPVAPYWVKITRNGSTFTSQYSADGVTWLDIVVTPAITITMTNDVYIGLVVTSHAAGVVCGAKFSSVSTTGSVSGSWQIGEIGVAQAAGNTPEMGYVAVQDLAGKMKVVSNLDPGMIASGVWVEWNIPLSQFTSAGINLNNVKKLIIGIGDRNAPKTGGKGKLYIDDIRLTRMTP